MCECVERTVERPSFLRLNAVAWNDAGKRWNSVKVLWHLIANFVSPQYPPDFSSSRHRRRALCVATQLVCHFRVLVCIRICAIDVEFGPVFVAYDNNLCQELERERDDVGCGVGGKCVVAPCLVAKVYTAFLWACFCCTLHESVRFESFVCFQTLFNGFLTGRNFYKNR